VKDRLAFEVRFIVMIDYTSRTKIRQYGYSGQSFVIDNRIRLDIFGPPTIHYPIHGLMAGRCQEAEALRSPT
jgi:hypothetical protein